MIRILQPEDSRKVFEPDTRFTPRPYQQVGVDRAIELYQQGAKGAMFKLATGLGKSHIAIMVIERWLRLGDNHRVLVLCHERQLVQQFTDRINGYFDFGIPVGVEMGNRKVDAENIPLITVVSRQTLRSNDRLSKFDPSLNYLIVIDEAHRYSETLISCSRIFSHFDTPGSFRLALSATPTRSDGASLESLFPEVAANMPMYDTTGGPSAVSDGWCVGFDQRFVHVSGVDFTNLREVAGDFDDNEIEAILLRRSTM